MSNFKTITAGAPQESRMDRNFRVYSEGPTTNQKIYKDSTTLAKVNENLSNLRTKQRHYYERVP